MPSQVEALERTLTAGKAKLTAEHEATVALCRLLAEQMDDDPKVSTRLAAAYLSALKDLGRALSAEQKGSAGAGTLASVRSLREVDKPTKKRAQRSA